jgi:hypothetical protein
VRFWKGGAGVGFVGWWVGGLEGAVGIGSGGASAMGGEGRVVRMGKGAGGVFI